MNDSINLRKVWTSLKKSDRFLFPVELYRSENEDNFPQTFLKL